MNQSIGTAIRATSNGLATTTNVNVSALTVTSKGAADVVVQFLDGAAGTCLWEMEADNASGSHSVSFPAPIHFSNGVYVQADVTANFQSACIAIV